MLKFSFGIFFIVILAQTLTQVQLLIFTVLAPKIDKCTDSKTCHKDAFCQNTDNSFECNCRPGFSGDGQSCKGIKLI